MAPTHMAWCVRIEFSFVSLRYVTVQAAISGLLVFVTMNLYARIVQPVRHNGIQMRINWIYLFRYDVNKINCSFIVCCSRTLFFTRSCKHCAFNLFRVKSTRCSEKTNQQTNEQINERLSGGLRYYDVRYVARIYAILCWHIYNWDCVRQMTVEFSSLFCTKK